MNAYVAHLKYGLNNWLLSGLPAIALQLARPGHLGFTLRDVGVAGTLIVSEEPDGGSSLGRRILDVLQSCSCL